MQLVIAGDGEERPRLERTLEAAGRPATIRLAGAVDDATLARLMASCDLFALPSRERTEGFGLPPLEAMACGVPVLTTDAGSLGEVVGDAAFLIDPADPRKFGAGLITCVVEPSLADELRGRGLARARQFSWERTSRETAAAYESEDKGEA